MAGSHVDVNGLADAIKRDLSMYGEEVTDGVKAAVDKVSKDALKTLKVTSPVGRRPKHYQAQWRSKTQFENRSEKRNTLHNLDYRLPHLLERPHQTRGGGRTRGQPHVEPAEAQAVEDLQKMVEKVIENGGK